MENIHQTTHKMMNETTYTNNTITPSTSVNILDKTMTLPPPASSSAASSSLPALPSPDLTFPWRLFILLRNVVEGREKNSEIISWTCSGKAFQILNKKLLVSEFLQKYFTMSKYKSFTRQLSAYGFTCSKHKTLPSVMVWSHPNFIKDHPDGCYLITRRKKGAAKAKVKFYATSASSKVSSPESATTSTTASPKTEKSTLTPMYSTCMSYSEFPASSPSAVSHTSNKFDFNMNVPCLCSCSSNGQEQFQQELQKLTSLHQQWQPQQEQEMRMVKFPTPSPSHTQQRQQQMSMPIPVPMEKSNEGRNYHGHNYNVMNDACHCISPSYDSHDSASGSHHDCLADSIRMMPPVTRIPKIVSFVMAMEPVEDQSEKNKEGDCFEPFSLKSVVNHEQGQQSLIPPTNKCCSIQDLDKALETIASFDSSSMDEYSSTVSTDNVGGQRSRSDSMSTTEGLVLWEPRSIGEMDTTNCNSNDAMGCCNEELAQFVVDCDLQD